MLGGVHGDRLNRVIHDVYVEFQAAIQHIQHVTYQLLDPHVTTAYHTDYTRMLTHIRDWDTRLGSILSHARDDCMTLDACIQLLSMTAFLCTRHIIYDSIKEKLSALVSRMMDEMRDVTCELVTYRDMPPVSDNMPRYAGTIAWAYALLGK